MASATTGASAADDKPPRGIGAANGKPGKQGTTTWRSVSSGSTRSKRSTESGQPCKSSPGSAAGSPAR